MLTKEADMSYGYASVVTWVLRQGGNRRHTVNAIGLLESANLARDIADDVRIAESALEKVGKGREIGQPRRRFFFLEALLDEGFDRAPEEGHRVE